MNPPNPAPPPCQPQPAAHKVSRRALVALGGLGALAIGGLATWAYMPGGYMTDDARRYRALLADPMAADPLLGHHAVRNDHKGPDGIFGKGVRPWVRNYFRDDTIGPQALADKFLAYALEVGWTLKEGTAQSDRRQAYRHHPGLNAQMNLYITDYTDYTGPVYNPEQPPQKLVSVKVI